MQPKGKSSLALWNEGLTDKDLHRGLPHSVATPLKRILGNRLGKGDRKTSNSRESNGHHPRAVQLDMPHARQLLTEVSKIPMVDQKYIVPSKYGQHHKNKMEELQGRIFKTHHLSSLGNREDSVHQNHSLLFNSTLPQKRLPFGYYLPATMKNRSAGLRTHNSQTNHDSLDLDSYLMRINRPRNPGSQTATYAYLDKARKGMTGLLPKKKSSDKSPVSQLNKTYDFADRLKPKSKHSRSSKKSRPGSLGAIDENEADPGKSSSWRYGRRTSEQVTGAGSQGKGALKSDLKQTSVKNRKKSLSRGKYGSTDNAEKASMRTSGKSQDLFEKLQRIHSSVKAILDSESPHPESSVQEISDLFSQFVKLQNKFLRSRTERGRTGFSEESEGTISSLCSKLIKYFCYYNKKYIKSYVYTRNLALKSLKLLEEFIGAHKVAISSYVPSFFTSREQVTLVDAVKMMKDLTTSLLHENKQLTSYIREQAKGQSKGLNGSKRDFAPPMLGTELEELRRRLTQNTSSISNDKLGVGPGLQKKKPNGSVESYSGIVSGKPKNAADGQATKVATRPLQSSDSKRGRKSKTRKSKQQLPSGPSKPERNTGNSDVKKDKLVASSRISDSTRHEREFGSAEGVALEADIEGGDYLRARELVKEMEDSAIMRFQSEEDYQRELGPSNPDRLSALVKTYPGIDGGNPDARALYSRDHDPDENSSFDHAESSGDFVPVEALNNPELAKMLQQRANLGPGSAPTDPNHGNGRMLPTVVVENDAFKQKLKLNLPKVKATDGYHEEFMKHFDEFSPSWRDSLMKEKNSKYY